MPSAPATLPHRPPPDTQPPRVGVLALQGAFREHRQAFERLGAAVREVRKPEQLEGLVGLVIPGGESTTMAKLMATYGSTERCRPSTRPAAASGAPAPARSPSPPTSTASRRSRGSGCST
jgi:hypothetical protein